MSATRVRGVTAGEDRLDHLLGMTDRQRDGDPHHSGACPLRDGREGVERRVVLVIIGEELVSRPQAERLEDGGHARRGVRHEDEALGIGVQEGGNGLAGGVEPALQLPRQELERVRLELREERLLELDDGSRAGPVRAVGEERDRGVEIPRAIGSVRAHRCRA